MSEWCEHEATLINEQGLHAYPSHVVAQVASCFKSEVIIRHGDTDINAKSVVMLLGLSADSACIKGTRLTVRAKGNDARAAAAVVAAVLSSGFGED